VNGLKGIWTQRLFGSLQDAPAPTVSGQSSAAGQQAESKQHQTSLAPLPSPPKDTKEGGKTQASASSPPPPPPTTQETNSQKAASPPPGGPGPNGGTGQEDTGSQGRRGETDKLEAMEKCVHKCSSGKEFSACLQVSDDGNALVSIGNSVV
jgi:hypothetical protein